MWIRRNVEEPQIWQRQRRRPDRGRIGLLFTPRDRQGHRLRHADERVHAVRLVGPQQLGAVVSRAAVPSAAASASSSSVMSMFVILMQAGMWLGYVSFGYIARRDRPQARRTSCSSLAASVLLPLYGFLKMPRAAARARSARRVLRHRLLQRLRRRDRRSCIPPPCAPPPPGVCYNTGRIASAAAPFVVGSLAASRGFFAAFAVAGVAFLLAGDHVDLDSGDAQRRAAVEAPLSRTFTRHDENTLPAIVCAFVLATSVAQPPQTVQDEYALYDLLAPDTASFRTVYEVSVTTSRRDRLPRSHRRRPDDRRRRATMGWST